MNYVLYNPLSGHGNSQKYAEGIVKKDSGAKLIDITSISSYPEFFSSVGEGDTVTLCGGDGTLNRFANAVYENGCSGRVLYVPTGTGNDFYVDVCDKPFEGEALDVTDYVKGLPTVTVNGVPHKFINGVGYGIDGYCCEVGDELKAHGKVPNYTGIAIKGLLFKFKPRNAKVTIDGVEREYKKVWIAPTMFGRHYGGGMIPTPDQKRGGDKLSLMLFHGSGKLKTLMIFPSIFKGEHVKSKKFVEVIEGSEITVRFDKPTPLQIDGETILNVTEYTARVGN